MLHISIKGNKAKIVYPRKWQMRLNLENGIRERIPNKPFPSDDDLEEKGIGNVIEGIYNLYETKRLQSAVNASPLISNIETDQKLQLQLF